MEKKIGKMIALSIGKGMTQNERNKFSRKFYGYTDRSRFGKYTYFREGWLGNIPHLKPVKSVLIVRQQDCQKVLDFLKSYNAEIFVRDVLLTKEDEVILRILDGE